MSFLEGKSLVPLFEKDEPSELTLNRNEYIKAAKSKNTRRAYQADIKHFLEWGGQLPTTPEQLCDYLTEFAPIKNPRTLKRRLIALRKAHHLMGITHNPVNDELVTTVMEGIENTHGKPKKKARILTLKELDKVIDYLLSQEDTLMNCRDLTLLRLGYMGTFRRDELVNLKWEHVEFDERGRGLLIHIPKSKTDQKGSGKRKTIPIGKKKRCAVQALHEWRFRSGQTTGYVFRRFSGKGTLLEKPITGCHCNQIIKRIAKDAQCDHFEDISAHSLRRGSVTEAAWDGASIIQLREMGGWNHIPTLMDYIEDAHDYGDSAVNSLFKD